MLESKQQVSPFSSLPRRGRRKSKEVVATLGIAARSCVRESSPVVRREREAQGSGTSTAVSYDTATACRKDVDQAAPTWNDGPMMERFGLSSSSRASFLGELLERRCCATSHKTGLKIGEAVYYPWFALRLSSVKHHIQSFETPVEGPLTLELRRS